jgi:transposase
MDLADAQWGDVPGRYPSYQTCHPYFQEWCRDGALRRILQALAKDLYLGFLWLGSICTFLRHF